TIKRGIFETKKTEAIGWLPFFRLSRNPDSLEPFRFRRTLFAGSRRAASSLCDSRVSTASLSRRSRRLPLHSIFPLLYKISRVKKRENQATRSFMPFLDMEQNSGDSRGTAQCRNPLGSLAELVRRKPAGKTLGEACES